MSNSLYASLFSLLFAIKHLSKKVCLFVYLSENLFDDPFDHLPVGLPIGSYAKSFLAVSKCFEAFGYNGFSHLVTLRNSFFICCPYFTSLI